MFLPPVQHLVRQSVGIGLALTDPYSRGTLRLASSDPDDAPLIDPGCKSLLTSPDFKISTQVENH